MFIMRRVFRSSANTCPCRLSALLLLCKAAQPWIAPMEKKSQKPAQKRTLLMLFLVTINCLNVGEIRIWPITKCLAPSEVALLRVFKINYLLKEEVFSEGRAQTCTNVKPFQKLSGFHLFRIVNHLHLRKKMKRIKNSMEYHLETSNKEVYEY